MKDSILVQFEADSKETLAHVYILLRQCEILALQFFFCFFFFSHNYVSFSDNIIFVSRDIKFC